MNTAQGLFTFFLNIINGYIVPVVFAIAFLMFLIGVYRYFIAGGASEEKVQEGQKFVLWSVVGFVIMFSIWGLVNLFINTLGFDSSTRPALPTFGAPGNTSNTANTVNTANTPNQGNSSAFPGNSAPVQSAPANNPTYSNGSPVTQPSGDNIVISPDGTTGHTLVPGGVVYSGGVRYPIIDGSTIESVNNNCPPGFAYSSMAVYPIPICSLVSAGMTAAGSGN